jgi:predicted AAA+ superfamily ATPase
MKQQEIAEILRKEVGELEVAIKKVQARCDRFKRFVIDLEDELNPTSGEAPKSILDGKFREVIDKVFGEKPKRPKQPKK